MKTKIFDVSEVIDGLTPLDCAVIDLDVERVEGLVSGGCYDRYYNQVGSSRISEYRRSPLSNLYFMSNANPFDPEQKYIRYDYSSNECRRLLDIIDIFLGYGRIDQNALNQLLFNAVVSTKRNFCPIIINRLLNVGARTDSILVAGSLRYPEKLILLLQHEADTKGIVDRYLNHDTYNDEDLNGIYTLLVYGSEAKLDNVIKIVEGKTPQPEGSKDLLDKIACVIIKNYIDKYGTIPPEIYSYFDLLISYTLMSNDITLEDIGVNYDGSVTELFENIMHAFDGNVIDVSLETLNTYIDIVDNIRQKDIYKKFLIDDPNYKDIVKEACRDQRYKDFSKNVLEMEIQHRDFPRDTSFTQTSRDLLDEKIFTILRLRKKIWTSICIDVYST